MIQNNKISGCHGNVIIKLWENIEESVIFTVYTGCLKKKATT
jgi:hypothetical protein